MNFKQIVNQSPFKVFLFFYFIENNCCQPEHKSNLVNSLNASLLSICFGFS